jgi:hypothetical protein
MAHAKGRQPLAVERKPVEGGRSASALGYDGFALGVCSRNFDTAAGCQSRHNHGLVLDQPPHHRLSTARTLYLELVALGPDPQAGVLGVEQEG